MYRYLSIAAVVLSAAFSGPALAEGINSFSQAKAAAVKVHADATAPPQIRRVTRGIRSVSC